MNFEIVGVHPANKGAVLMMEAIRARLSVTYPGARFAVPMHWAPETRLAHGLWVTPGRVVKRASRTGVLNLAPTDFKVALGYLAPDDIDVLLDASGFGYGDVWGLPKLRDRLADRLAAWKGEGKKAVLLPQALGPFDGPGMAAAFQKAVDRLDLTFVRDAVSMKHVTDAVGANPRIVRSPDFTNLLQPDLPRRLEHLRGASLIVPNEKMVTGKDAAVRVQYLAFLKQATEALQQAGRQVTILLHEGQEDRRLADELNAQLATPAPIVNEPSALDTKAIVGAADIIISSRFHALVSALSAAVPALACGWSHKYAELMSDYDCADLTADLDHPEAWASAIERLLNHAREPGFRAKLAGLATIEKDKSKAMWAQVEALIDGR